LLSPEFLALNAIMFLTYCNVAVFFQFYQYLQTLPIPSESFGLLIALFSLTVLVFRPIISPFLTPDNAGRWIRIGCLSIIGTLVLYNWAESLWSMAAVRLLHGGAYVLLATAVLSRLIACIPSNRSGQAFGLVSIITVLPYAVVPPVLSPLLRLTGGFREVLNLSALAMVVALLLAWTIGRTSEGESKPPSGGGMLDGIWENLKDRRILLLLGLSLVVWTTFTPVFFFLEKQGSKMGIANPGWFLTLSTAVEILVRLVGGPIFDKLNKALMLAAAQGVLCVGYLLLASVSTSTPFFATAIVLGLGWGVAMPLLSGLMFDISRPKFRALNSNLAMEMFQAGFFIGPLAGGAILLRWDYAVLYIVCAICSLVGLGAAMALRGRHEAS
jgi:predicted MFS family arabinose efflux permease